ncbi:hypothetical protein BV20DRAFT_1036087 [Pilatotrama ljubarskyi]|nr:hypothetical protein BV20DRAFT_1036087 [Pilatotrama ljubarskyi]
MQFKLATLFALGAVAVHAAPGPEKRDGTTVGFTTVTLPSGTQTVVIPTGTVPLSVLVSFLDAHSALYESLVGTSTFLSVEASVVLQQASVGIATATQLTAFETTINSTPVVEVSSKGGIQVITVATGTAGATTSFGGEVFTAVPNAAQQLASVPHALWTGAAAVLGSLAVGAALVL